MAIKKVNVPDVGDFKKIPVIEVLVQPGDIVQEEDSLITLESDKATMDVPSPMSGIVKEVHVKLNDEVSEGQLIISMEPEIANVETTQTPVKNNKPPIEAPTPEPENLPDKSSAKGDLHAEVVVLGSGPGPRKVITSHKA